MAKEETDVTHRSMLRLSPMGVTLFKNVRGLFKTLDGKRKVQAGLLVPGGGGSDGFGFTEVIITPEMLGIKVAIVTVIEMKKGDGTVQDNQWHFIDVIKNAGGIAGVSRSADDSENIILEFVNRVRCKLARL